MDNTIQELHKHIAFLERENKELGKSLKMLQSAPEYVKDGDLKAAIEEFGKSVIKDETPITRGLLEDNFDKMNDELYNIHLECDVIDIYIQDEGIFHIIVKNKGSLLCRTCSQLRMFLTLCGLGDFANQLKS